MSFYTFMPKLFNMSLTASVAIVLVVLLRLLLKKAPKVISYALWGVVLFRLLCPVSIGSSLSLYNLFDAPTEESGTMTSVIEYVPSDIVHRSYPSVVLPVPGVSDVINEALPQGEEQLRADPLEGPIFIATYVWMTGVLVMAIYSIVSYIQLRRKLSVVVPLQDNIFIADDIKSPFVVGLFRPKIYLPCNLEDKEQEYIILHEQHHIKRLDHIMKALAFLALAIHWFNPLVWVAFILAGKDMEMSCDEAVIRKVGGNVRADYSASLLTLATGRRIIAGTPLAFGEGDTKGRIHNLSKWKKPALWIVVVAGIACAIVAVCILTNPVTDVEINDIESVTVDNINVSDEAADELISLINSHRCTPFMVGADDPNTLSRAIQLNCTNGDFYLLHYQYYSGFSFDPRHPGEDDYRSILTFFTSEEGGQKAWQMEYDFDTKLRDWLFEYSSPSFGAFSINQPYGVVEVTYENGMTSFSMVAQVNTPEYLIDENKHLFSVKEHSDVPTWTDLGELTEIIITEENFDELFQNNSGDGWFGRESASEIRKNTVQAWSVIYNQDVLYYILQQRNGELYLAYGYYDYSEKNDPFSDDTYIRWLYKIAPDDTPIKQGQEANGIVDIVDPTEDENFAYDTAIEKFFENESNKYYFSGIYSQYVIVHYADGTTEDISTALRNGRATIADLDRFGIQYWAEPKGDSLDAAISTAILDHYASDMPDGLIHVESHVLLANETVSGTPLFGADNHKKKTTVYLLVHHVKYSTYGGKLEAVGGSYVPAAITFKISDSGEYILDEYWEPRDGSYYVDDVRDKFPGSSADDALNDQAYIEDLKAQTYNKALAYLNNIVSLDVRIATLLDEIQSSPAYSSNPGDYIHAHEAEYEELLGYGEYTLRYCFTEFLQGGQIGLRGHIMALGCQDIMLAWGERYAIDQNLFTGQDWFDEFRRNAESLSGQFSHEELEKNFPGAFLFLHMSNGEFMTRDALN